ncbi:low-density lipoprotein receptor-related protein 6-like, partial [Tropilaelaps mercedesae]
MRSAEGSCDVALCGLNEWTCHSGAKRCIPLDGRCNAKVDCHDKSDERDCCSEADYFKCSFSDRVCIFARRVCDKRGDCEDGSDEIDCEPHECRIEGV